MTEQNAPTPEQRRAATERDRNLSWIAMVVMAAMCLATLVYAGSINLG